MKNRIFLYSFILILIISGCNKKHAPADMGPVKSDTIGTFTNPLLVSGADPWVVQKDSFYYYMSTMGNRIVVRRAYRMASLEYSYQKTIWAPPADSAYSSNIWAPEMHFIQGKWYVYFAADDGNDANHGMYVLENDSPDPLAGTWNFKGKIAAPTDNWAIDGTVLEYNDGLYFIWSGWKGDNTPGVQQLYIAKMKNPWTLTGDRVMISEPEYDWEKNGLVNEGPEILKNKDGNVFLIYSASGCWTDNYSLGMMSLKKNGDPLNPQDWTKSPNPLFTTDASSEAFSPGHCGFFKSPDGKEDWIIYHANKLPGQGCGSNRSPRMQKFTWNADGTPYFGRPLKIDSAIAKPSGWQ